MAEKTAKNIYQRMAAITAELGIVAKDLTVSTGKNGSYKGVSERVVLDAVKPLEEKHGVYSYPHTRVPLASEWLEQEGQYGKKLVNFMRLETLYRFVNVDDPTDYVEMIAYGDGIDSGDKATGKAMTYSDKYALMKAYKISTGDDPDQEASGTYSRAPKAKAAPAQTPGDALLSVAKPSSKEWKQLYNLAATECGVNKDTIDNTVKEMYGCEPKDLNVDAFQNFRAKIEHRAAKMKAEREAALAEKNAPTPKEPAAPAETESKEE